MAASPPQAPTRYPQTGRFRAKRGIYPYALLDVIEERLLLPSFPDDEVYNSRPLSTVIVMW
eukprot:6179887-Pleurochrysis_carterae.AAC.10